MDDEARVDPSHVERIRAVLRDRADDQRVKRVRAWIEHAHENALLALRGDDGADLRYSHLAWAKTALDPEAEDRLPARTQRRATKDGAIAGFGKYEEFDPLWLETLAEYLDDLQVREPDFGRSPAVVAMAEGASLAVAGDWATGYWQGDRTPAAKIAVALAAADYTIHLGDTYYAGTQDQVKHQLRELWPKGRLDCFAIPGNHEMYTKAWPFRDALAARFPNQNETTFFALRSEHWLVLALDTAYFATGMYLRGRLRRKGDPGDNAQIAFAREQLASRGARRVILFTHHPPFPLEIGRAHV